MECRMVSNPLFGLFAMLEAVGPGEQSSPALLPPDPERMGTSVPFKHPQPTLTPYIQPLLLRGDLDFSYTNLLLSFFI